MALRVTEHSSNVPPETTKPNPRSIELHRKLRAETAGTGALVVIHSLSGPSSDPHTSSSVRDDSIKNEGPKLYPDGSVHVQETMCLVELYPVFQYFALHVLAINICHLHQLFHQDCGVAPAVLVVARLVSVVAEYTNKIVGF